jgi:hypothetical protein
MTETIRWSLMRTPKSICTSLFFVLISAAYSQSPADGFYLLSDDASAPSVLSQDGKRVSLGPLQEVAIQRSDIYSEDNANSTFWITVGIPYEVHVRARLYVLVVADHAYPWAGSESGNGLYQINFRVSGANNARDISRFLSTPIAYRKHPGHQLLVSFIPALSSFRIGDEVRVKFRIENIGTNSISFQHGGQNRASRDNQYTFSAQFVGKQVQDIGTNVHHGGLAVRRVLQAGEVFVDEISLSKWFAFNKKGQYEVFGSYDLRFYDPNNETSKPIWTDYVSGEFLVKID